MRISVAAGVDLGESVGVGLDATVSGVAEVGDGVSGVGIGAGRGCVDAGDGVALA